MSNRRKRKKSNYYRGHQEPDPSLKSVFDMIERTERDSSVVEAIILAAEGSSREIAPTNGTGFTVAEVTEIIGEFEVVGLSRTHLMLMNEDGKARGLPPNSAATWLFQAAMDSIPVPKEYARLWAEANEGPILGDVVVCDKRMLSEEEAEGRMRPVVILK